MSDITNAVADDSLLGEPDAKQFTPKPPRTMLFGTVAVLVIFAAAAALVVFGMQAKERQFHTDLERRLMILATGRSELVSAWLDDTVQLGNRVAQSDFFRLFAQDIENSHAGTSASGRTPAAIEGLDQPTVAEQMPLMTNVLTDFVANAGLFGADMLDRRGDVVLSAGRKKTPISPDQKQVGASAIAEGTVQFGPVRLSSNGLVLDLALPIFPPALNDGAHKGQAEGVLVLQVPAGERVSGFLGASPLAEPWEKLRLIQKTRSGFEEVVPKATPPLRPVSFAEAEASAAPRSALIERPALGESGRVYAVSVKVPALGWWIVQEAAADRAYAEVSSYNRTVLGFVGLVVVVVLVALGAFWWRLVSVHNQRLALQFRSLAQQFKAQKRFLDSINNTIVDQISLKDLGGAYRYVNPAFARAVEHPLDDIIGLDDVALFGAEAATRLRQSDELALATDKPVTSDEQLQLGARLYYLQLTKIPFRSGDDEVHGIVSVARDVTELVEEQKKRERAVKQMVLALVRAIELRDPYLAGHSQRVAALAAGIARHLNATPQQVATLEIAANLCQIGKLSISRSLLNKPGRLTKEEILTIQGHVEHTASVLRNIDFELPVFEAIYQMNERLDGSGYPQGIKDDQITLEARILAACDVFCARVEPRSYRPEISVDEAIDILDANAMRYDERVIAALRVVAHSPEGVAVLQHAPLAQG